MQRLTCADVSIDQAVSTSTIGKAITKDSKCRNNKTHSVVFA